MISLIGLYLLTFERSSRSGVEMVTLKGWFKGEMVWMKRRLSFVLLCPWEDIIRLSLVSPLRYVAIICRWELGYISGTKFRDPCSFRDVKI